MQRLRNLFRGFSKHTRKTKHIQPTRYVLVLSGGGTRGFYTLGVLKALEEAGLQHQVDAVYGISI
jgi:predicted acylesterase/phospholipase RssA